MVLAVQAPSMLSEATHTYYKYLAMRVVLSLVAMQTDQQALYIGYRIDASQSPKLHSLGGWLICMCDTRWDGSMQISGSMYVCMD